jgi:hypothetical protein
MKNISMPSGSTLQHLLGGFDEMPLKDIEYFIRELNALATRKRSADKGKRDKYLLRKINEAILPELTLEHYISLQEQMEVGHISAIAYQELLRIVAQEEKIRNKRFQYLLELSQLRGVSLVALMQELGLNTRNYA